MIPGAQITNEDGQTGVAPSGDPEGIAVIVAASRGGTLPLNTPTMFTDYATASTAAGQGPLPEIGAYMVDVTGNPFILLRVEGTQGDYEDFDNSGMSGTSHASGHSGSEPVDNFLVYVVFPKTGTIGTDDMSYQVSLDGDPTTLSDPIDLGTATQITIPNTGIVIDITGGTVNAGDSFTVQTKAPMVQASDLADALAALAESVLPWEALYIDGESTDDMIATVDEWLASIETVGEYKLGVMNGRYKQISASETESAFASAMTTLRDGSSGSTRITVGADGVDVESPLRSIFMRRLANTVALARTMKDDAAVMSSYIADGALDDARLTYPDSSPKYHNEQKNPGLDDLGFTTLRSVPRKVGAFVNLPRMWSEAGSDWVFVPHARVMNLAKSIAYDRLTEQCSIGVHTQKNPQNPNVKNIKEADAAKIEGLVQDDYDVQLTPKRCTTATFSLSRADDLSSNGPNTVTGTIAIDALRYVTKFKVNAKFV